MICNQKVLELEEKIEKLIDEIEYIKEHIWLLIGGKMDDPSRPYYAWLLWNRITDEKRTKIEFVITILDHRLKEEDIPEYLLK